MGASTYSTTSTSFAAGYLVGLLIACLVLGVIGALIGSGKGRGGAGFALGFLLGPIGWIIVAVMSPSPAVQAQRDRQLAQAIAAAQAPVTPGWTRGAPPGSPARPSNVPGTPVGPQSAAPSAPVRDLRKEAVTEALRRDPSLAADDSADGLARFDSSVAAIERELTLKAEREAAVRQLEQERQAEERRKAAEAEREAELERNKAMAAQRAAREEERRIATAERLVQEDAARQAAAKAEQDRLAAMSPTRRWAVTHKGLALALVAMAVAALVLAGVLVFRGTMAGGHDTAPAVSSTPASVATTSPAGDPIDCAAAARGLDGFRQTLTELDTALTDRHPSRAKVSAAVSAFREILGQLQGDLPGAPATTIPFFSTALYMADTVERGTHGTAPLRDLKSLVTQQVGSKDFLDASQAVQAFASNSCPDSSISTAPLLAGP